MSEVLRNTVRTWQAWYQVDKLAVRESYRASNRKRAREDYAAERFKQGKIVRPHRFHQHPESTGAESREAYELRLHRDRQRNYRGVTPETVRPYCDLTGMSVEEKAAHKKEQNRLRQQNRRSRARTSASTTPGSGPELSSES